MGDDAPESSTETDASTTVSTTTSTSIGDIGLTGDDAIALAGVLEQGIVGQTRAIAEIVNPVINAASFFAETARDIDETPAQTIARNKVEELKENNPTPLILIGGLALATLAMIVKK